MDSGSLMPQFKTSVTIRRIADGVEAHYEQNHESPDLETAYEGDEFMWNEGNYSCDCNRHIFFNVALGRAGSGEHQIPCGNVLYSINNLTVTPL